MFINFTGMKYVKVNIYLRGMWMRDYVLLASGEIPLFNGEEAVLEGVFNTGDSIYRVSTGENIDLNNSSS